MTLAAELYDWLLFLHILAAAIWVGGAVLLGATATLVLHQGDRDALARFVASLRVLGPVVLAPATVAVAGLGVWLTWTASPGAPTSSGSSWPWRSSPPPSSSERRTRAAPRSPRSERSRTTTERRHGSSAACRGATA